MKIKREKKVKEEKTINQILKEEIYRYLATFNPEVGEKMISKKGEEKTGF